MLIHHQGYNVTSSLSEKFETDIHSGEKLEMDISVCIKTLDSAEVDWNILRVSLTVSHEPHLTLH